MYWGQIGVALLAAIAVAGTMTSQHSETVTAATIGVLVYIGVRWLLAWYYRTRYWYRNRSYESRSCPSCGQYIYRKRGDWILTCYRCGWRAGWPGVRWVTRSIPVTQLRRTIVGPSLIVAIVATALVLSGATAGVAIPDVANSTAADTDSTDQQPVAAADATPTPTTAPTTSPDSTSTVETATSTATPTPAAEPIAIGRVESLIFELVNDERSSSGLPPLGYNERAYERAKAHAEDMAANNYFSHTSQDGVTQEERYSFCNGGENAYQTWAGRDVRTSEGLKRYTTAEELAQAIFTGWMNSEPHRERGIRGGSWSTAAVGVAITDDGKVYAVMGFCQSSRR